MEEEETLAPVAENIKTEPVQNEDSVPDSESKRKGTSRTGAADINSINEFYETSVEPLKENMKIGYHQAFFEELAIPLLEDMDTLPRESIVYLGYSVPLQRTKRHARLDAYYWDEASKIFYAYVAVLNDTANALSPLDKPTFVNAAEDFQRFIEKLPYISINGEKSNPGYEVAQALFTREWQPVEFRLTVVSDMVAGSHLHDIEPRKADKIPVVIRRCCLNELLDLSSVIDNTLEIDFANSFKQYPIQLIQAGESKDIKSFLCAFPGIVLARLYQQYSARLLEGNVRVFLGLTKKINREMKATVLDTPERIFAFNNGLSVTAVNYKTQQRDGMLYLESLTGMKIVNGGQTTATLASAYSSVDGPEALAKVFVPMKINIVDPGMEQDLVPLISKYANSQNAVSKSAFESNSPFQIQMERIVEKLHSAYSYYWTYERLQGAYKQESIRQKSTAWSRRYPDDKVVSKEEFTKYMALHEGKPYVAALGDQKCFTATLKSYNLTTENLKDNKWTSLSAKFSSAFVIKMLATAIFTRAVLKACRIQTTQCALPTALYTVAFILCLINYSDYGVFPYEYVWNKQTVPDVIMEYAMTLAPQIRDYIASPGHVDRKGKPILISTEWAKKPECWEEITRWAQSLPESVIQCLVPEDVWVKFEETSTENFKDAQERSWKEKLIELGYGGWDLMLHYLRNEPIGATDDEINRFMQMLETVHVKKSLSVLKQKDYRFIKELHDKIRECDHRLLPPLV